MSISSSTSRNDFVGNGVTSVFSYTFDIFLDTDLLITVRDTDDNETTLTLTTDYTVSGAGDSGGGDVTLVDAGQSWITSGALTTDYKLTIRRVVPLTQLTDIRNQGDFFPEVHEDQFDKLVQIDQQQQDELDRSCKNPETVPTSEFDPTLPGDIATADKSLITNSSGTGFTLGLTGAVDAERVFNSDTYANLKALAIASPTKQRWGWATDTKQLNFYTADLSIGDEGWIIVG